MKPAALVALTVIAAQAQAQVHGDWEVGKLAEENAHYAITINDSGGFLAKKCEKSGCTWLVSVKANCTTGDEYPALLSTHAGAFHVTLACDPGKDAPGRYKIKEYRLLEEAVKRSEKIGFAMAMESGEFRVTRFATQGWEGAMQQLANKVKSLLQRPTGSTDERSL